MVCNGQAACQICGMEVGRPQNHLCVDAALVSPLVLYHLGIYEEFTCTGVDVTKDLYAIQEISDLVGKTQVSIWCQKGDHPYCSAHP